MNFSPAASASRHIFDETLVFHHFRHLLSARLLNHEREVPRSSSRERAIAIVFIILLALIVGWAIWQLLPYLFTTERSTSLTTFYPEIHAPALDISIQANSAASESKGGHHHKTDFHCGAAWQRRCCGRNKAPLRFARGRQGSHSLQRRRGLRYSNLGH